MGILAFQKPDKIKLQKADDFHGTFEFKPLEPGFGVTIGNALRRVMLSSLEGYAITSLKIDGVDHEFSTIKGVIEDVPEIILNLKQIRFKRKIDDPEFTGERIFLSISGSDKFTAADIEKHTASFEVTNPDLVICNISNKSTNIEMELTVGKGRGYVPAEENNPKDAVVGLIPIDSIYTPIKNVRYFVDNTRVEQKTDYEQLNIEIQTDGTIHPEDALKEASNILMQHLGLISDKQLVFEDFDSPEEDVVDEHVLHMRKILKTPLEDLDLSVRAYNCNLRYQLTDQIP